MRLVREFMESRPSEKRESAYGSRAGERVYKREERETTVRGSWVGMEAKFVDVDVETEGEGKYPVTR